MRESEPNRLVVCVHNEVTGRQVEGRDGSADRPKLQNIDMEGCLQTLPLDSQMAVHLTGKVDQTHQSLQTPAGDAACVKELAGRRLDFVPDVLGRLPVSCLWVPLDAQPLESRLRLQLRLLEIDLEPHDRESLEGASDMLAKD